MLLTKSIFARLYPVPLVGPHTFYTVRQKFRQSLTKPEGTNTYISIKLLYSESQSANKNSMTDEVSNDEVMMKL